MKVPKLSDSILLGSTLVKGIGGEILRRDGSGCALGMGLVANGINYESYLFERGEAQHRIWPWLAVRHDTLLALPCGCDPQSIYSPPDCYEIVIAHLFDNHVTEKHWTLEQLCDYVRSVEPAEVESRCEEAVHSEPVSAGVA